MTHDPLTSIVGMVFVPVTALGCVVLVGLAVGGAVKYVRAKWGK